MVRIPTNVAVSVVQFRDGPRLVSHQLPASKVRQIRITPELNEHYVMLLAQLSADVSSD
jgi:hypothetical protein